MTASGRLDARRRAGQAFRLAGTEGHRLLTRWHDPNGSGTDREANPRISDANRRDGSVHGVRLPLLANDDDRAGGVLGAALTDRTEHGPGQGAPAAATHHEEVGTFRGADQELRRITLDEYLVETRRPLVREDDTQLLGETLTGPLQVDAGVDGGTGEARCGRCVPDVDRFQDTTHGARVPIGPAQHRVRGRGPLPAAGLARQPTTSAERPMHVVRRGGPRRRP